MPVLHLLLVAAIQGLTEFLPVSSSGHLVLLPGLTGLEDQGRLVDIAVHVGTLGAVLIYFRGDVAEIARGLARRALGRPGGEGARMALLLAVATVPVGLLGIALRASGLDDQLRSVTVVGWATLAFGLVLYWADRTGGTARDDRAWTMRDAWIMGLWQALALVPGTSRSGVAISAARRLGFDRRGAARLAMLMSIPVILALGLVSGAEVALLADMAAARDAALAAALAFLAALLALAAMMRLLRVASYTPFVAYRVVLGAALLWYGYAA